MASGALSPQAGKRRGAQDHTASLTTAFSIPAAAEVVAFEDAALGDPVARLLEHLARIGLEHDALARPPAARVHLPWKRFGNSFL